MLKLLLAVSTLLPFASLVAQGGDPRPYDYPPRSETRPLTKREASVTYRGCTQIRRLGLAPLRAGEPGYRPWMDGDLDGLACEPVRGRR